MYLSLMPLPVAVATVSELMHSHSHNAVRLVLLCALVDMWLANPPTPSDAPKRAVASPPGGSETSGRETSSKVTAPRPGFTCPANLVSSISGDYPNGVVQFWDLLREFLLGDPVKGVRLAVLNAVAQVRECVRASE